MLAFLHCLNEEDLLELLSKWKSSGKTYQEYAPYAFYYYRVNTFYLIGLSQNLISTSKEAKIHLDIQYLYYLPFSQVFTSGDKLLLKYAQFFAREDQIILPTETLRKDLINMGCFFDENKEAANGFYPPKGFEGTTKDIWHKLMAGQSETTNSHKLPKTTEKEILNLSKMLNEALTPENETIKEFPLEDRNDSIIERNKKFVNGVLSIVGLNENRDWDFVRKNFSSDHVKKIFDLHADIWHPKDNFLKLANELKSEEKLRCLYLGDVEPFDAVEQIWKWAPYFEQILIVDPFHSPWAMNEKFNPLSNPKELESDTIKLVYFLMLILPLFEQGKIIFIQDPLDYDPKLKKLFFEVSKKKTEKSDYMNEIIKDDMVRMKKIMLFSMLRTIARLPEDKKNSASRSEFGDENFEIVNKLLKSMRTDDPICIDREAEAGELILSRSGANFESSLLLCSLYGAIPLSTLHCRHQEYLIRSDDIGKFSFLKEKLLGLKAAYLLDPVFGSFVIKSGLYEEFLFCLRSILKGGHDIDNEMLNLVFSRFSEECSAALEVFSHHSGLSPEYLFRDEPIELLYSKSGFLTDEAAELINAYNKDILKDVPKFCISVTPSKVPDLPFMIK